MGSVVCQLVLQAFQHSPVLTTLQALILTGPPAAQNIIEKWAFKGLLAGMVLFNKGQGLIRKLSFDKWDSQVKKFTGQDGGQNSWLNSDPAGVAKYNADPLCGHTLSFKFWQSMLANLSTLDILDFVIPSSCRILVMGGDTDACGDFGKSVADVRNRLQKQYSGDAAIEQVLYPGARHEILHDHCKVCPYNCLICF